MPTLALQTIEAEDAEDNEVFCTCGELVIQTTSCGCPDCLEMYCCKACEVLEQAKQWTENQR